MSDESIAQLTDTPVWDWFGLSRASYLVVPRLGMQAMPTEWQRKMVALMSELEAAGMSSCGRYRVHRTDDRGRLVPDPWADYRRGDAQTASAAERESR